MSEQEIDIANQLIEDWFSIAIEATRAGEGYSQGWSTSILQMCKNISDADVFNGRGGTNPY
jgi:hypothetical protein